MCGKRLRKFSLLLPLLLLLSVHFCFSETVLTDEETEIIFQTIQNSKEHITDLELKLTNAEQKLQSAEQRSQNAESYAETLEKTSIQQKEYYEELLREAERKTEKATITYIISTVIIITICLLL